MSDLRRTSTIIREIIEHSTTQGEVTIGEFVSLLGDRSFYLLILVFALPNSLPMPPIPGVSTVTGIPIVCMALQLLFGRQVIWLPKKISSRRFSSKVLATLLSKTLPAILWLEKILRPRLPIFTTAKAERFIGLLILVLAILILPPIPGMHLFPAASMSLISLAMLEKDGLVVLFAVAFSVISIFLVAELFHAFIRKLMK
jgi:hypothetical protein